MVQTADGGPPALVPAAEPEPASVLARAWDLKQQCYRRLDQRTAARSRRRG